MLEVSTTLPSERVLASLETPMGRRSWLPSNPFTRWALLACLGVAAPCVHPVAAQEDAGFWTAAQVRELSEAEASKELPVRLRGVYMGGADPAGIAFLLQDQTDSIYAQAPAALLQGVQRGDILEIEGVTNPGGFAPYVVASKLAIIGKGEVPPPEKMSVAELSAGHTDAKWVEVTGIIRSIEPRVATDTAPPPPGTRYDSPGSGTTGSAPEKTKLKLASGGSEVMVEVYGTLDPEAFVDSEVRIRGLCYNLHNSSRQFVKPFLQVPQDVEIMVERAPAAQPFTTEPRSIASLLQFERLSEQFGHRVHVRGVVIHHRPGAELWVRDDERSLRVETKQEGKLLPGDEVDVLGFQALGVYSPILEDAVFRKRSSMDAPKPRSLGDAERALERDADLVQLEADLSEVRHFHDLIELTLLWNGTAIRANMHLNEGAVAPESWQSGSRVRVTGICAVVADEPEPLGGLWVPKGFELLLRSPADLAIVRPPPWWDAERIVWLLSAILVLTIAALGANMMASNRRLKDQEQRRQMAEAEFSAILKERNRVAREIHDTLSQSLGAISMHLELARTHSGEFSDTVRGYLGTAHRLARSALAEARESIWNMRSQFLEKGDLGEALEKILKQATDGTDVRGVMSVKGPRHRLSPFVENNLLRIGQEAIANACKHGSPSLVDVELSIEGRLLRLRVEDDGAGFVEAGAPEKGRKSFGLVGIRERVDLLKGTVDITSMPGKGTRVLVEVSV